MYDNILLPTDGRAGTDQQLTRALDLARTFEATVHALYVIPTQPAGDEQFEAVREPLEQRGHSATMTVQDRAEELDLDVVREIREGTPFRTILEYVQENDIDLTVMGTPSQEESPGTHLGSTTERVLVRSETPVLTVELGSSLAVPENRYGMYDRVVIATDGSDAADRAAEEGLRVAELYGADVRVIYALDTTTYGLEEAPRSIVGLLKEGGQSAVDDIATEARSLNLSASSTIVRGVPEEAILEYADGTDADLIVMGTRGQAGLGEGFLGSTTARVVWESDLPILTVS